MLIEVNGSTHHDPDMWPDHVKTADASLVLVVRATTKDGLLVADTTYASKLPPELSARVIEELAEGVRQVATRETTGLS